jgi:hypothetical protein
MISGKMVTRPNNTCITILNQSILLSSNYIHVFVCLDEDETPFPKSMSYIIDLVDFCSSVIFMVRKYAQEILISMILLV